MLIIKFSSILTKNSESCFYILSLYFPCIFSILWGWRSYPAVSIFLWFWAKVKGKIKVFLSLEPVEKIWGSRVEYQCFVTSHNYKIASQNCKIVKTYLMYFYSNIISDCLQHEEDYVTLTACIEKDKQNVKEYNYMYPRQFKFKQISIICRRLPFNPGVGWRISEWWRSRSWGGE